MHFLHNHSCRLSNWQWLGIDGWGTGMDHVWFGGSSLGHTGSWNRWWEFGTCQAPDRFLQFTDSSSMRNPMGSDFWGVGLQNAANAERIQASDVIWNLWMRIMHVCVMLMPKRTKQYSVIFRGITAGVYQCQQHELMSTGINRIVVRGISDGQSWGTTCHKAIANRM